MKLLKDVCDEMLIESELWPSVIVDKALGVFRTTVLFEGQTLAQWIRLAHPDAGQHMRKSGHRGTCVDARSGMIAPRNDKTCQS